MTGLANSFGDTSRLSYPSPNSTTAQHSYFQKPASSHPAKTTNYPRLRVLLSLFPSPHPTVAPSCQHFQKPALRYPAKSSLDISLRVWLSLFPSPHPTAAPLRH